MPIEVNRAAASSQSVFTAVLLKLICVFVLLLSRAGGAADTSTARWQAITTAFHAGDALTATPGQLDKQLTQLGMMRTPGPANGILAQGQLAVFEPDSVRFTRAGMQLMQLAASALASSRQTELVLTLPRAVTAELAEAQTAAAAAAVGALAGPAAQLQVTAGRTPMLVLNISTDA